MTFRLGRRPHDPVRLAAAPAILDHTADASAPPDRLDRSNVAFTPTLGDNGWAPDCTGESLREVATAIAAVNGYPLAVADGASLRFFCQCAGLPVAASQDQIKAIDGAVMLDVAQRQWRDGFNVGPQTLFGLFGTVPPTDRLKLAAGAQRFALGWWGIRLYQRDEDAFFTVAPLDDDGSTDNGALIGGHAIGGGWGWTGLGDTDEVLIVTWGAVKPVTWRWVAARLEEAHAFRFRQLDRAGVAAVDEAGLTAALQRWAA